MEPSKIPVFILAGGLGTRLSEETNVRPKPMVEIGGIPILVHIMRRYYAFGFNDFVICAGYKSWEIKQFFIEYRNRCNHIEIDHRQTHFEDPKAIGKNLAQEKWRVRVIDTGKDANTGCRIARAFDEIKRDQPFETFAVTYGDGLSDHDFTAELKFHVANQKMGTVLGVRPQARFGELDVSENDTVKRFLEKPESKQNRINGGFFYFKSEFRDYLKDEESCVLEKLPLEKLASEQQLKMFRHDSFWHPMDTLRDKTYLEELWNSKKAPWLKPIEIAGSTRSHNLYF